MSHNLRKPSCFAQLSLMLRVPWSRVARTSVLVLPLSVGEVKPNQETFLNLVDVVCTSGAFSEVRDDGGRSFTRAFVDEKHSE